MPATPRVSILMAVHNGVAWLAPSLRSIREQTYQDYEFVIVDDASNDGSSLLLQDAAAEDSRIILIRNESQRGLAASLNRGLEAARGAYVARQDADDVSERCRIARQVEFLDAHSEIGVVGSELLICNEQGLPAGRYGAALTHADIVWRMLHGRAFAHPSVMFRRDVIQAVGGYDAGIPAAQDFDLWTRLVGRTRFANLPAPLVRYRSHRGAVSRRRADAQRHTVLNARRRLLERFTGTVFDDAALMAMEAACETSGGSVPPATAQFAAILQGLEAGGALTASEADAQRARLSGASPQPGRPDGDGIGIVRERDETLQGLTIVILSYDRLDGLYALLDSLQRQRLEGLNLEIMICNNAVDRRLIGRRRLAAKLAAFPDVKILDSSYNWGCAIRYGIATMAKYETVLFIDDDIVLNDLGFVRYMYDQFLLLERNDILSCWTSIWAEWDERSFAPIGLTFLTDESRDMVEVDTIGPGISMFRRDMLVDPNVLDAIMSPVHPRADDMAFSMIPCLVQGSRKYFLPCYGMLRFHRQWRKKSLTARPKRFEHLHAMYKDHLRVGYEPVLTRQARMGNSDSMERKLARRLPRQHFEW